MVVNNRPLRRRVIKRSSSNSSSSTNNPSTVVSKPTQIDLRTNSDELLTPIQTADLLSVTSGTLSVWRSTGRYALKYIKLGGLVRYRKSDVLDFLNSRTKPGIFVSGEGGR